MGEEQCYWHANTSGAFIIKSAYERLNVEHWENQDNKWNIAWKFPRLRRIKTFLWLIIHNAILTNDERFRRHISPKPWYQTYYGVEKDQNHCIRMCIHARAIWAKLVPEEKKTYFLRDNAEEWLSNNLKDESTNEKGIPWNLTFGVTCWMLWKARNARIFNKPSIPCLGSIIRILAE